jgi:hypothetical protein
VPFLLSVLLVGVGLVIRLHILETPAFARVKEAGAQARRPVVEVLRTHARELLLAIGVRLAENASFYIYTVFVLVYATEKVGMGRETVLGGIVLAAACSLVAIPTCGALADRLGRRPVYLFGACATALFAYPLFLLLDSGSAPLVWLSLVVALVFAHAPMYGPQGAFLSEPVRHASALQRRFARLAAVISRGRRTVAVHRHDAAALRAGDAGLVPDGHGGAHSRRGACSRRDSRPGDRMKTERSGRLVVKGDSLIFGDAKPV